MNRFIGIIFCYLPIIIFANNSVQVAAKQQWQQRLQQTLSQNKSLTITHLPTFDTSTAASPHKQQERIFTINFLPLKEVLDLLANKHQPLLSSTGSFAVIKHTRQIVMRDDAPHLRAIAKLLARLDQQPPQILIKTLIVNIDRNYIKKLGLHFVTTAGQNLFQASSAAGILQLPLAKLMDNGILAIHLAALEQSGHARILSAPELLTLNAEAAHIEAGEDVPYQEQTRNGGTSVTFKKATLKVQVTPRVLPERQIYLQLVVNQDKPSTMLIAGMPAIRTQALTTHVILRQHQLLVLGGIIQDQWQHAKSATPLLSQLPLVGRAFQMHDTQSHEGMLLIFVTPEIISPYHAHNHPI